MFDRIVERIGNEGWVVVPDFLPSTLISSLRDECACMAAAGDFRAAAIGSGADRRMRRDLRADEIVWLDESGPSDSQRQCLAQFERLRFALNQRLQLGLFEFECHLARYVPGAFYRKHLDRFRGDSRRKLSCVLYLNERWLVDDGGQLRLYADDAEQNQLCEVLPVGATLAAFLSERFPHEVLPARRERLSLAGWFKTRS